MAQRGTYMVTRGYEVVAEGSAEEIAAILNRSASYVRYLSSELHHKKVKDENALFAYRVDEEIEDWEVPVAERKIVRWKKVKAKEWDFTGCKNEQWLKFIDERIKL